ncbi:acyltransferase [Emticicia fluvialis]|uniref:acyltransferase n=1 Tax=Emticicia fluvialis TaxID=2974474 RepID=UPI00286D3BC4|nr:acyltransferase [Emticicia fluvialis]
MKKLIILVFRVIRFIIRRILKFINNIVTYIYLYCNNVSFSSFSTNGVPHIIVNQNSKCIIGENFQMNNTLASNPIGRPQKCCISVNNSGFLKIGSNVGMSSAAITCMKEIIIGDNVTIGGGVCIYDSDFHPLNPTLRILNENQYTQHKSVTIEDNVFIGAHSTILKGVRIGKNSIVGACSVVSKSIPENEIWAGNPAKFIKKIQIP